MPAFCPRVMAIPRPGKPLPGKPFRVFSGLRDFLRPPRPAYRPERMVGGSRKRTKPSKNGAVTAFPATLPAPWGALAGEWWRGQGAPRAEGALHRASTGAGYRYAVHHRLPPWGLAPYCPAPAVVIKPAPRAGPVVHRACLLTPSALLGSARFFCGGLGQDHGACWPAPLPVLMYCLPLPSEEQTGAIPLFGGVK